MAVGHFMKISKIFYSLQGEGKLIGMPSTFVRAAGCNLRCTWCDTPYTSWEPVGDALTVDEILARVRTYPARHVVVTGGEPMAAPDIGALSHRLRGAGYHVTMETAGTVWSDITCDLASISPKLSNSTPRQREGGKWADAHEGQRINIDVIRRLMALGDYQLKFVVQEPADIEEIGALLARIGEHDPASVMLMPQGTTARELAGRAQWLVPLCKEGGFRYCPRLHIDLFGNTRGT